MNELIQLRNNIDFASISQFLHTFQSAFGPWTAAHQLNYPRTNEQPGAPFETEDLESMILQVSERIRLEDMFVRMLRILTRNRFINHSSWQNYFAKEFDKREPEEENPFYTIKVEQKQGEEEGKDVEMTETTEMSEVIEEREAVNYFTLPLDARVHLIYLLCEWQMDEPEKLREHLETEDDCIQWRVDPIGFDKRGDIFWLFDDNRLYKESVTKPRQKKTVNKKKRSTKGSRRSARNSKTEQQDEETEGEEVEEWKPWRLLCASSIEWEHIPEKYAQSTHVDEKHFYDLLVNDVLPKVLPVVIEHEKDLKKREAIIHRKRSSRIMIKELEALERVNSIEPEEERKTIVPTATTVDSNQRSSSRIERKTAEKEEQEREMLAKAREERLLEREKRIMEREYRRLAREKREEARENGESLDEIDILYNQPSENNFMTAETATAETVANQTTVTTPIIPLKLVVKDKNQQSGNQTIKKKRGRKPKMKMVDPATTDESWMFDCICGVKGENLDDGSPMIACELCGIWQHIKCLRKFGQVHANKKTLDNITFICRSCRIKNGEDVEQEQHRPIKKQKIDNKQHKHNKQQQQQHTQVTLPNIQIWDRVHSPQITIISPQPPLQPQPIRPILQVQPQPPIIQSNLSRPILEPKPISNTTITSNNNNTINNNNNAASATAAAPVISTQPAAILEPQPAILEPNHSFQSQPHPPPILPQPVLPSPQQAPPSKPSTILPPQPPIQSTILPSSFQRASPLPPPPLQQQPPSIVQETRSNVIQKPQQSALEAQPPIQSIPEFQPTTVINELVQSQSTPTQSATDVTLENQEKPPAPSSNNNSR